MKTKVVLFDLDATLLPLDINAFLDNYLDALLDMLCPFGYDRKTLGDAIIASLMAMIHNDGKKTNEEVYWEKLCSLVGEDIKKCKRAWMDYYINDYDKLQSCSKSTPRAAKIIESIKKKGYPVVLATNPLHPKIAIEKRVKWAGLCPEDFDIITTYENYHYSKPNLKYYEEIVANLGVLPYECLMIGNDAKEDMAAGEIGMKVFLLTEILVNGDNRDISIYPHGDFDALEAFLEENL